jgi:cation/acetate symporter
MIIYVVFGGMLATTWVQIIKAVLLMSGTIFLSILVLKHFDFSFSRFFDEVSRVLVIDPKTHEATTKNFLLPGMKFGSQVVLAPNWGKGWGPLDLISLGLALVFGTAGLPHILVRFYTVPDAKTARVSVVWAMILIGLFYIMTTFLGFGAATILTPGKITVDNMAAPLLAQRLGGDVFFAFISAVAFATILAVVAGLTISASTSFAHDFYSNVIHHGRETRPGEEVFVARVTAFVVGAFAIFLAIQLQTVNVAFLVGLAFAVAASANLPVIVLTIFWRRFNTAGAVAGLGIGLLASIVLIILSPSIMGIDGPEVVATKRHLIQHLAIFPLTNPGIVSIPLGFLAAILATLFTKEPETEKLYTELVVRANTGLGAETASAH